MNQYLKQYSDKESFLNDEHNLSKPYAVIISTPDETDNDILVYRDETDNDWTALHNGKLRWIMPDDEIWYWTTDNVKLTPNSYNTILKSSYYVTHTFENNKGIIKFNKTGSGLNSNGKLIYIPTNLLYNQPTVYKVAIPNTVERTYTAVFSKTSLTSFIFPDNFKIIGDATFSYTNIDYVDIPTTITTIVDGAYAFSNIKKINIPSSVKSIGASAFQGCLNLYRVTLNEGLEEIKAWAFCNDVKIKSLHIPASVTTIGNPLTIMCSELEEITVDPNNTVYDSRNNCNAVIRTADNTLVAACKNTIIPEGVENIHIHAYFSYNEPDIPVDHYKYYTITQVNIPSTVKSIDTRAFESCQMLQKITVHPDNTIYDSRDNCNAIIKTESNTLEFGCSKTIIPNTVTSIASHAFSYLYTLKTITIPTSITTIYGNAFYKCNNLKTIIYEGTEEMWNNIDKADNWINSTAYDTLIFNG